VLKKYDVEYFRCPNCGFLQTEEPYWLEEAYRSPIAGLDIGPINRALTGSRITEGVISAAFDPNAKFIDWGGGYGIFTRLMRDKGYDFYWRDLYCENLFAKQFAAKQDVDYELMTCFEVFEHLAKPMDEVEKMLKWSPNILFSTLIPQMPIKNATDWWYMNPDDGQHISIYSVRTLEVIAKTFGLHLTTDGAATHLFSKRPVSKMAFNAITRDSLISQVIRYLGRRKLRQKSLLPQDFRAITGWDV
jgi:hypothetical protein